MAVDGLLEGLQVALEGLEENKAADKRTLPYYNNVVGLHNELLMLKQSQDHDSSKLEEQIAAALSEDKAEQIFQEFSNEIKDTEEESINFWNTLSEAFVLRGMPEAAVRFAKKVQRKVNSQDFDEAVWDQSLLRLIRSSAYWVIETNGEGSVGPS
jgi:hypothetical protein